MKGLLVIPDMARAILREADPKTNTRRVIRPQPTHQPRCGMQGGWFDTTEPLVDGPRVKCDYVAGERRCLLTTWAVHRDLDHLRPLEMPHATIGMNDRKLWHAGMAVEKPESAGKSRPGRFLPNALRHLMPVVEIVSVRAERVQDITEADAKAEGAQIQRECTGGQWIICGPRIGSYREGFRWLWNSINSRRGYGWTVNPWVWRVEFRRIVS